MNDKDPLIPIFESLLKIPYQVVGHGGVDGPGDDEPDGLLSGLPEDGGDLLGAHAPQADVAHREQVVPVLQGAVLEKRN